MKAALNPCAVISAKGNGKKTRLQQKEEEFQWKGVAKKMDAETFLERYQKIDTIIKSKQKKIEDLNDNATNITSHLTPDKVQTSGNGQKIATAVDEALDLADEIEPLKIQRTQIRREIENVIEQLPTLRYKILHRKYILFKENQDIADEIDRTKDTVNRQIRIAIEEVQGILDGNNSE